MSGAKIIEGLKAALAGDLSRVSIDGQTWTRVMPGSEPGTCWQPIETAPKDGTKLLLWTTTEGDDHLTEYMSTVNDEASHLACVQIGQWDAGHDALDPMWSRPAGWETTFIGNPTHWMPVPAPPEVKP